MRIERLVLHGFKSFADRTELALLPGVTAVVGPNGSGKSNLVEAIRFVVGARAGRLRARGAGELIFQGAPGRRPAGFAEVVLGLAEGLEVRRRIYRDGRQEVRLGGERASLRQVAQALAGSGLGPSGAAIIGQGQVAGAIEAPPERLLAALIEAAGLAGVEAQAREAEQRLAAARARLDQRAERVEALANRRAGLARAAEEARRARELARERLGIRRHLLARTMERAERAIAEAEAREAALKTELARLTEEETRRKAEQSALRSRMEAAPPAAEPALLAAEEKRLAERAAMLAREAELLAEQAARLEAELAERPPLPDPPPRPQRSEEELDAAERALKARIRAEEERLRKARARHRRYLEAQARYQAALEAHRAAQTERERLESERRRLAAEVEALTRKRADAEAARRAFAEQRDPLAAELRRLEAELAAVQRERAREQRALRRAAGPRALLEAGLPGVLGSVGELLVFPPELRRAAEAALGGRVDWVLVADEAALRRAVAWLKERGLSATLLARDLAQPPPERPVPRLPGVEGRLRDRVGIPGEEGLTRTLLGETLLARDLDAALTAFRASPRGIVTREGERLEPSGAVSTGRGRRGSLEARARWLELEAEEDRIKARLRALERRLAELKPPPDPAPLDRALAAQKAELQAVLAALRRLPKAPPPIPPEPVPEPDEDALNALRAERERLVAEREALFRWRRYQELAERHRRVPALQRERARLLATRSQRLAALERTRTLQTELAAVLKQLDAAEALRRAARKERAAALDRLSRELEALGRRREELRSELEAVRIGRTRQEVAWEAARKELAQLPPGPRVAGDRARLRAIEAELAELEPVNYRAEAELAELDAELERERAELEEARLAWQRIAELLEEVRGEFDRGLRRAREVLARRFAHYAGELLGGHGEVQAVPGGLRLALAPEGKRVRALRLLSTGEKTMGALALLFALAEVREGGLPIAVLDEVDAALDEANLTRFANFLKRFKAGRQVLLVTHQKRSLEAADAVLGVTSQEGVSRVYGLARAGTGG